MNTTGNTILITGGGTGIGRGLAEAFHALGNQVIIAGRSQASLDKTVALNPGMAALTLDITDAESITDFSRQIISDFPELNGVINNAGMMKSEDLLAETPDTTIAEATVITNLLGPIRLISALLPHLRSHERATIMNVTSGLAFLPLTPAPTYCATKAALHSYSESLRYQLRDTSVEVFELVPPYVQTSLGGEEQANDPRAMPLDEFITEVMKIITAAPANGEICVERVRPLRDAPGLGEAGYHKQFIAFNEAMAAER
jgi:uncharacterized oxidoreductase